MTGGAAHADAALFTLLGESLAADILGPRANLDTLSPGAEDVRAVTVEGMAARVGIARLVVNGLPGSGMVEALSTMSAALSGSGAVGALVRDFLPTVGAFRTEVWRLLCDDPFGPRIANVLRLWRIAGALGWDVQHMLGTDPEAWVAVSIEAGEQPLVVVQPDGSRGLYRTEAGRAFDVPLVAVEHMAGVLDALDPHSPSSRLISLS